MCHCAGFNGTVRGRRTLMTGRTDIRDKGMMVSWGGARRLGNWSRAECSAVRGRDPGTLTVGLQQHTQLELYFASMCRTITFAYRRTVQHAGISTYRCGHIDIDIHSSLWRRVLFGLL